MSGLDSLQNDVVIVPKLFRRLVEYLHLGDPSLAGFPAFLDQAADGLFILSTGHATVGLDLIVEVQGNNVRMTRPIEDLRRRARRGLGWGHGLCPFGNRAGGWGDPRPGRGLHQLAQHSQEGRALRRRGGGASGISPL
ncbi:MAG: hypothetical protein QOD36_3646, partial [Mycobacterium sp.]|nr:hypothetical protein [Mycobacterium sp.]